MLAESRPSTNQFLGILALLAAAALWSLNGPLIKLLNLATSEGAGLAGATIAFYRSLVAALLFVPLAWKRRASLGNAAAAWSAAAVISFTVMTACFVTATTMTSAAAAIILQYTSPLWVFLLAPLMLRERPRAGDGLTLAVAMVGVLVMFMGHPTTDLRGLQIALLSGLGYGCVTVALRGLRRVNPLVVTTLNCLGSGLLLLLWVAWYESFTITSRQLGLIALMGVVQFAAPYVLFSWALQRIEAHKAALIVLIEAVLNPIWTFLTVGEIPDRATLLGGPLILAGVAAWLVLSWRREARTRAITAPVAPQ